MSRVTVVAAEDVLPGHPDRLCDALAEAIVEAACRHDPEALVGVEVALHRHLLVVTGRVAAGPPDDPVRVDVDALAAAVLAAAGYTGRWHHRRGAAPTPGPRIGSLRRAGRTRA
jgi:S-adenosylmethionine synthetase